MPRAKEGNPACKPTLTNNNWQLPDNELHKSSSPLPPRTPAILSDCPVLTRPNLDQVPRAWNSTDSAYPALSDVEINFRQKGWVSRPNASGRRRLTPRQFSFAGLEIGDWDWRRGGVDGDKTKCGVTMIAPRGRCWHCLSLSMTMMSGFSLVLYSAWNKGSSKERTILW